MNRASAQNDHIDTARGAQTAQNERKDIIYNNSIDHAQKMRMQNHENARSKTSTARSKRQSANPDGESTPCCCSSDATSCRAKFQQKTTECSSTKTINKYKK